MLVSFFLSFIKKSVELLRYKTFLLSFVHLIPLSVFLTYLYLFHFFRSVNTKNQRIFVCWHFAAFSCVTSFVTFSLIHFLFVYNVINYRIATNTSGQKGSVDCAIGNMICNALYSLRRCSSQNIEIVSD